MSSIRDASRRTLDRISRRPAPATQEEVAKLRRRIKVLEQEMREARKELQEARRLHRRLAELTDVVEELLVPLAQRDEAKLQEFLDAHSPAL